MPKSQNDLIGKHPVAPSIFDSIFTSIDQPVKKNQRHRSLTATKNLSKKSTIDEIAKMLIEHHYFPHRIERLKEKYKELGYSKFAAKNRKLPVEPSTKKGNATEVLMVEYAKSCIDTPITMVYRLRYNSNVDQAMKGDDMLLARMEKTKSGKFKVKLYLGEAKFRGTPSKAVVEEITRALGKDKKPLSLTFMIDELSQESEMDAEVEALEEAIFEQLSKRGDLIYCGFLFSDSKVFDSVEKNLDSNNPNLVFVSASADDPDDFIEKVYKQANELLKNTYKAMTTEKLLNSVARLEGDGFLQNLIAQANATYILFNTQEKRQNFPAYLIDDERLNLLAFYYLELGCGLAERKEISLAREPLEKGASVLEFVHGSAENDSEDRIYYALIAALGYYVSFQYSKAFVLINKIETNTKLGGLISAFIKRDFVSLEKIAAEIIASPEYEDGTLSGDEESAGSQKIYEISIARSLVNFVNYFYTGDIELLKNARAMLTTLKEIAELRQEPEVWWVIRLLCLIQDGLNLACVWQCLNGHFDTEDPSFRKYLYSLVFHRPKGIYELFVTQRASLLTVLNKEGKGSVVSIPTSSGKTRIAEIAILDCLRKDPQNKVLYVAPFKSLAYEIENSFDKIFENSGIAVSHLYGGNLYSRLDEIIIEESNVIIATPEKAKAILRGNSELMDSIKLIIIDEGHLLGPNKRYIVNEAFYEELRYSIQRNGGRFIVLSAVLPNPEDLAQWLTESKDAVYKDKWRPSDERLGILEYVPQKGVNLLWESSDTERESYNNNFIEAEELPWKKYQRNVKYSPDNQNEAVAMTAHRFQAFGPVLIFVGLQTSVFVMAKAYKKYLTDEKDFVWNNQTDWKAFELACLETYGDGNLWYEFAKKGILCHSSALNADVRLPLDRLMRNDKARVIIATSTLGQGVNLGVSTVIFSTLVQGGAALDKRDFWNIAGRAGRAFVDHEGKVLVAVDRTKNQLTKARKYFEKDKMNRAQSGLLFFINRIREIAADNSIDFERLLELIAENKLNDLGKEITVVDDALDWIDDALLSLHDTYNTDFEKEPDYGWIEDHFRKSLAYLQASSQAGASGEYVLSFIKARVKGITAKVGTDRLKWRSIVKSGIPLNSDLMIEAKLPGIIDILDSYEGDNTLETKIELLGHLEEILGEVPVVKEKERKSKDRERIRELWLSASPMSEIVKLENGELLIKDIYTYILPWILNGVAKKLRSRELKEQAEIVEQLSMITEVGLPTLGKLKVYQAGIKSRIAANEIGELFDDELWKRSIRDYRRDLIKRKDEYKKQVSERSGEWIELLYSASRKKEVLIEEVEPFKLNRNNIEHLELAPKLINGAQYLVTADYNVLIPVSEKTANLSTLSGHAGIYFRYDHEIRSWKMEVRNPYIDVLRKALF